MYTHSLRPVLIGLTAESGTQEGLLTSAALPNPTQLKDTQGSGGAFGLSDLRIDSGAIRAAQVRLSLQTNEELPELLLGVCLIH